ncbi:MAG: hypothetical protein ABI615_05995 [Chthoniobacterales bacterium]
MKQSRSILCLIGLLSFTTAYCDDTAYQALKVVKSERGEDILKNLVEMSGDAGDPQPNQWKMLFNDSTARNGVREIVVEKGAIASERTPVRGFTGVGDMPALKFPSWDVDSDKVFRLVESQALQNKVGFHRLDYTLRGRGDSAIPVWSVRLFDHMGASVGKMEVSAANGDIIQPLTLDTDYVKHTASSTEEEPSLRERWREDGGLVGKAQDVTKRTGKTIKRTTLRVGGAVQEFFTGERTIDEGQ